MRRFAAPIAALVLSVAVVFGASAQINNVPPPNPGCAPLGNTHLNGQRVPTTLEPEFGIWCYAQPPAIPPTRISGANDWVDTFDNNGLSILRFEDHDMGYRVFNQFVGPSSGFASGYFVNVNHWMIDLADISTFRLSGGVMVSPDRQFQFENGKFVLEVDAAAGSDGMSGANRFYEIDLTPAAAPTGITTDALYGYGSFGMVGAMGCRLERNDQGGNFVCAMYDNSGRNTGTGCVAPQGCTGPVRPGRVWETQGVGSRLAAASIQGGYPEWPVPGTNMRLRQVWRQCGDNELDVHCRDRFRMEVTKDSIHLFVNGYPAMFVDGLLPLNENGADSRIPDAWFQQGVRPYFTSWINGGQHTPTRWHWDRVVVNPHDTAGNPAALSAAPSFCLGQPNNTCPDGSPIGGNATSTPTPTSPPGSAAQPTPTQGTPPTPTSVPSDSGSNPPTSTPVPGSPPPPSNNGPGNAPGPSRSSAPSALSAPSFGEGGGGGGPALTFAPLAKAPVVAPRPAAGLPSLPGFHADFSAMGGQLIANNLIFTVPDVALASGGASLSAEPIILDTASQQLEGGFTLGDNVYRLRLVDPASGLDMPPAAPLSLTYLVTTTELRQGGGELSRLHPAVWNGSAWLALPCASGAGAGEINCSLSELGLVGMVAAPIVGDRLDTELANGHFYKQANGYAGAGERGFSVIDDADAAFWTELERMGGVAQVGYPVSGRFEYRGFLTQVFQKLALQWRPELSEAVPLNTLEELSQPGQTRWLERNRQVPPGPEGMADFGLPWDEVVSRHEALLDGYPALRAFYDTDPDRLDHYGLPLSVADYGPLVSVRLQRATIQLWTVDVPWAAAGTVVLGNSGDLAKEVGLWSSDALIPRPAGAYAQLTGAPN